MMYLYIWLNIKKFHGNYRHICTGVMGTVQSWFVNFFELEKYKEFNWPWSANCACACSNAYDYCHNDTIILINNVIFIHFLLCWTLEFWSNCVRRRRTLPNRHLTAGCYVNSRFSVYVAFASLSCGDLVERTRVCGITVHSAASDRL